VWSPLRCRGSATSPFGCHLAGIGRLARASALLLMQVEDYSAKSRKSTVRSSVVAELKTLYIPAKCRRSRTYRVIAKSRADVRRHMLTI
jgi:hypothetical protein